MRMRRLREGLREQTTIEVGQPAQGALTVACDYSVSEPKPNGHIGIPGRLRKHFRLLES